MSEKEKKETNYQKITHELGQIRTEVSNLRTTLLGIDGNNGIRGLINHMDKRLDRVEVDQGHLKTAISNLQNNQENCQKLFSTKEENNLLEKAVLQKLNEMDEKRESARKDDSRHMDRIKASQKTIIVSAVGIFLSVVVNILILVL